MATTLAALTLLAQQESDNVSSSFIAAAEWTSYINKSLNEIYGLTAQVYGADYYVQSPATGYTFSADGINQFFNLPTDFFKLNGIDAQYGSAVEWVGLKQFNTGDRNKFGVNSIPSAGQNLRLFYVPRVTALVNGTDVIPDALSMNGWDEYIVVDAAMKALGKEESDVSTLMGRKQALIDRINAEAENRDCANSATMTDSRGRPVAGMEYRLNGAQVWLIGRDARGWPASDYEHYGASW